jgi:hypothetical protein
MVDAANHEILGAAKTELHNLLDKPQLQGIPVLVLGNKRDLDGALDENQLIEKLFVFNPNRFFIRNISWTSFKFKELGQYPR